jgi:hypothetical protein
MSSAKLAVVSSVAAVALAGCGAINVKPVVSPRASQLPSRGTVDDPRTTKNNRLGCLRQQHLAVQEVGGPGLQIGTPPGGPSVTFEPSPGAAQAAQIEGRGAGAEVIGGALLYPHQASDADLSKVEGCLAAGVSG